MIAQADLKLTLEPRLAWAYSDPQTTASGTETISTHHHISFSAFFFFSLLQKNNIYLKKKPERHLENEMILPGASTFYILVHVLLDFFNFPLKIVEDTHFYTSRESGLQHLHHTSPSL